MLSCNIFSESNDVFVYANCSLDIMLSDDSMAVRVVSFIDVGF